MRDRRFSRFLFVSFQPGQMKSGKVRNGVDTLLYEYTVTVALIFARQKNIPFFLGRSINLTLVAGTGLEPASRKAADFKSAMFTNFITPPSGRDSTIARHVGQPAALWPGLAESSRQTATCPAHTVSAYPLFHLFHSSRHLAQKNGLERPRKYISPRLHPFEQTPA